VTDWTTLNDVRGRLAKRWATGQYLRAYGRGVPFEPISLPLRGPSASELGSRYADVQAWAKKWADADGGIVELEAIGSRALSRNLIPRRVSVDSFAGLVRLLGVYREVRTFDELLASAGRVYPPAISWAVDHPLKAIDHHAVWDRLLACVSRISAYSGEPIYLRQVDLPGVDTKFIESNRSVLAALLDTVLPDERVDRRYSASDFIRRYGFRTKPTYARLRLMGIDGPFPAGLSEISVRVDELDALAPSVQRVFIVENETTYLAFPEVPESVVIFGSGYALSSVAGMAWLRDTQVFYWGDIDTHGFRILDRLRAKLPAAQSFLMDRETLIAHEQHWEREDSPANAVLNHLREDESALYRDLIEGVFGERVRLEQERVRYSHLERVLRRLQALS